MKAYGLTISRGGIECSGDGRRNDVHGTKYVVVRDVDHADHKSFDLCLAFRIVRPAEGVVVNPAIDLNR